MMITLEMLEEVMERAGVDYAQAKVALQENDGSVEAAISSLIGEKGEEEEAQDKKGFEKAVDDTLEYVKGLSEKGLLSRLVISKNDETVLNIPLGVGVLGLVFASFFTVAGLAAAFLADYQVRVVTKEGDDINLNDYMEKAKEKVTKVVKEHTQDDYVILSDEEEEVEENKENKEDTLE